MFYITSTGNSTHDLVSILSLVNVSADLNGTRVNCTDIGNSFAETSTSIATVHAIKTGTGIGHKCFPG